MIASGKKVQFYVDFLVVGTRLVITNLVPLKSLVFD